MKVFVDSNILVYAHDKSAGAKNAKAKEIIASLWESESGIISVQVLQEVYYNLLKKIAKPEIARQVIENYTAWDVVQNSSELLFEAIDIQVKAKISFWDALIVAAAVDSGADELWSEDFNAGQKISGIKVVNPLK